MEVHFAFIYRTSQVHSYEGSESDSERMSVCSGVFSEADLANTEGVLENEVK